MAGLLFLDMLRVGEKNRELLALLRAGMGQRMGQSILRQVPVVPGQGWSELAASSPTVGAGGTGGHTTAFDRRNLIFQNAG